MEWQLQEAKNRLLQVLQEAWTSAPQVITLRGKRAGVLLSAEDYEALKTGKPNFVEALLSGPEWDDELIETVNARSKEAATSISDVSRRYECPRPDRRHAEPERLRGHGGRRLRSLDDMIIHGDRQDTCKGTRG